MDTTEVTVFKNTIYRGKILNLRVDIAGLPNGTEAPREFVEHNGGVTVAALTDDAELIFVKQFRYPYMEEVLELPAGKLEKGEEPLEAGKREFKEECGCVADEYVFLGNIYPTPGYTNEIIRIFWAKGLHYQEQQLDEDEFLDICKMKLDTLIQKIMNNEITDAKTIVAAFKLKELKSKQ